MGAQGQHRPRGLSGDGMYLSRFKTDWYYPSSDADPVGPDPDSEVGVDGMWPWINDTGVTLAGVDVNGPWIEDSLTSPDAGVDENGAWIDG